MTDGRGMGQVGPLTGLVAAVLYLASAVVPGSPLRPDASRAKLTERYVDHRGALLVATVLATVAVALLFWFLGYLWAALQHADGPQSPLALVTVVAWVGLLVVASAGALASIAVIWRGAAGTDPNLVQLSFDVENLSLYTFTAPIAAVSVLAPSLVIWRTRMMPRWLVALAAVEIAINVLEVAGIGSRHGLNTAGYAAGLGPLVWVVWVASVSVLLYRRSLRSVTTGAGLRDRSGSADPWT